MEGEGRAEIQDGLYKVNGDALEIISDEKACYTIDRQAKEVMIEVPEAAFGGLNPASFLAGLDEAFALVSVEPASFEGGQASKYALKPLKTFFVTSLALFFSADRLVGAQMQSGEGVPVTFVIKDLKYESKKAPSYFSFDSASLDKSWIITDLR